MLRIAGPLLACALALANAPANAQAGATPATPDNGESAHSSTASEPNGAAAQTPTVDDVCRALEQSAAENALPVEFFARVIWQESRFDARAVSPKGAAGIAQFMPATASWHGLSDPFDPIALCGTQRPTCVDCWTGWQPRTRGGRVITPLLANLTVDPD